MIVQNYRKETSRKAYRWEDNISVRLKETHVNMRNWIDSDQVID